MNPEKAADLALFFVCLAVFWIAWLYPEEVRYRTEIMWVSGLMGAAAGVMAVKRKGERLEGSAKEESRPEVRLITELVLLSEEDTELMAWNLYGKTAALIGRAGKGSEADIDLSSGPYASMVDKEHAVLNYSAGDWYVEDLGSKNGLSVKKGEDGKIYRLSADSLCKLEKGDCLYVGMNRLLLR